MKRLLCPKLPKQGKPIPLDSLDPKEKRHATVVLRLKVGDCVEAIDGRGSAVVAKLHRSSGRLFLEWVASIEEGSQELEKIPLTLLLSVLKGKAMDIAIEKAVETGVDRIVPFVSERTVVDLRKKGSEHYQERWQKIADQALKQCGRRQKLKVDLPEDFQGIAKKVQSLHEGTAMFWCDEESHSAENFLLALDKLKKPLRGVCALIGPEGGWSEKERTQLGQFRSEKKVTRINLSPNVLRAETAVIALSSTFALWKSAHESP